MRTNIVWCWIICLAVAPLLGEENASGRAAHVPDLSRFPKLSAEDDWPFWRGPSRNGIGSDAPVPTEIGPDRNVAWKSPVPGRGHSSPIVVGPRVFLATADEPGQIHFVLAFDRSTGRELWRTEINRGGFPRKNHAKNTEATPTLACDGERLFAPFFHHEKIELVSLSPADGTITWRRDAGHFDPRQYEYGYAPSPVLYNNLVIVAAEYDGDSFLTAFDRLTGNHVWRTPRPRNITFSSPVVARTAGRDQLLISGADQIASYDPANGKRLWSVPGTAAATCGTTVWWNDVVFASGGYPKSETLAVRADGSGDVLWRNNQKLYEQSLIVVGDYVYGYTDQGVMLCWRAEDGKQMWKQRLAAPISASPVYAGGHIYWANEAGKLVVFKPNPERFELVAENEVGESFASPAICGGQIFLRVADYRDQKRHEVLYCFSTR
ncbi:MAG TPA: PQQ-binding-like beta-propeller repeat protein [Pirellulales bacterium]|nr:PQQ-binding-like beta-propeller repeat protein [Pirellulales bacterium]